MLEKMRGRVDLAPTVAGLPPYWTGCYYSAREDLVGSVQARQHFCRAMACLSILQRVRAASGLLIVPPGVVGLRVCLDPKVTGFPDSTVSLGAFAPAQARDSRCSTNISLPCGW